MGRWAISDVLAEIEGLEARLARLDGPTRTEVQGILGAVLALHRAGLERILAVTELGELVHDELVSSLLALHDLHPLSIGERVAGALTGFDVVFESYLDGVVRLRCQDLSASDQARLEQAVLAAVPEVTQVLVASGGLAARLRVVP